MVEAVRDRGKPDVESERERGEEERRAKGDFREILAGSVG